MSSPTNRVSSWNGFGTAALIRKMFEQMLEAEHADYNSFFWKNRMQDVFEIEQELAIRLAHTDPKGLYDGRE